MIKAFFADFYGTVVHEDGEVIHIGDSLSSIVSLTEALDRI